MTPRASRIWTLAFTSLCLAYCASCSTAVQQPATETVAGGDLSGADCEIWIAPVGQREVSLWFDTETDWSQSPPQPLKIKLRAKNDPYCIGGQEISTSGSRTMVVKILADGTVQALYLDDPANAITYAWSASDLPHKDASVFGVDLEQAGGDFDLHVHYAGAALVIECSKGGCP